MHICSRSTLVDLTPHSILAATELPPGADHANQFRRPLELCRCASKAQEENSVGRNVQGCAGYAPCARSLRASPPGRREVDLRWTHMPPPPPTVCHAFHPTPPASVTASSDAAAAAAIAAHRLPAPLAARAQPAFRAQGSSTEGGGANDARPFMDGFLRCCSGSDVTLTERPDLLLDITAFQPHQVSAHVSATYSLRLVTVR